MRVDRNDGSVAQNAVKALQQKREAKRPFYLPRASRYAYNGEVVHPRRGPRAEKTNRPDAVLTEIKIKPRNPVAPALRRKKKQIEALVPLVRGEPPFKETDTYIEFSLATLPKACPPRLLHGRRVGRNVTHDVHEEVAVKAAAQEGHPVLPATIHSSSSSGAKDAIPADATSASRAYYIPHAPPLRVTKEVSKEPIECRTPFPKGESLATHYWWKASVLEQGTNPLSHPCRTTTPVVAAGPSKPEEGTREERNRGDSECAVPPTALPSAEPDSSLPTPTGGVIFPSLPPPTMTGSGSHVYPAAPLRRRTPLLIARTPPSARSTVPTDAKDIRVGEKGSTSGMKSQNGVPPKTEKAGVDRDEEKPTLPALKVPLVHDHLAEGPLTDANVLRHCCAANVSKRDTTHIQHMTGKELSRLAKHCTYRTENFTFTDAEKERRKETSVAHVISSYPFAPRAECPTCCPTDLPTGAKYYSFSFLQSAPQASTAARKKMKFKCQFKV